MYRSRFVAFITLTALNTKYRVCGSLCSHSLLLSPLVLYTGILFARRWHEPGPALLSRLAWFTEIPVCLLSTSKFNFVITWQPGQPGPTHCEPHPGKPVQAGHPSSCIQSLTLWKDSMKNPTSLITFKKDARIFRLRLQSLLLFVFRFASKIRKENHGQRNKQHPVNISFLEKVCRSSKVNLQVFPHILFWSRAPTFWTVASKVNVRVRY